MKIEHTRNGIIIETNDEGSFSYDCETELGDDDFNKRTLVMWTILDLLGWRGSKHDAQRIRIVVEPGSDYQGETNE